MKRRLNRSRLFSKTISLAAANRPDTIFLQPEEAILGEVIIRSDEQKIRRIINTAVRNKDQHNPDGYAQYQCRVYYKMSADLFGLQSSGPDSSSNRKGTASKKEEDDSKDSVNNETDFFSLDRHVLFAETYSHRMYRRPQQVQEVVLASRFSGLKKTYFHNIVTDVLPFHVYTDYITLNGVAYLNPIAKGWNQRYQFRLEDEIIIGSDTVFQLRFSPKQGTVFRALTGIVYINSDGYALSHFVATAGDDAGNRNLRFEQVYQKTSGRWFPRELNYVLTLHHFVSPEATLQWSGRSFIDSVRFGAPLDYSENKSRPIRLHDSVDLRSTEEWSRYRGDSITAKEQLTYVFMDSFSKKYRLEKIISATSKLAIGRLPAGKFDVNISRLIVQNAYEGVRLGLGLFTNNKISRFFSVGGWAGYGFQDKEWKGGGSLTLFPNGNKDHWLEGSYTTQYQNPGDVRIHEELDRAVLRNWVLQVPDRVEEYKLAAQLRAGYWEVRGEGAQRTIKPLYTTLFQYGGKSYASLEAKEATIALRYAYAESRLPVFDYYLAGETKYPRTYLRISRGRVSAPDYSATYWRALAAITFSYKVNGWGQDALRLEGGIIKPQNGAPLPRSLLLAGNGLYRDGVAYYSSSGFTTMRPYAYYSDRYASLLYRHHFDRSFWNHKYSKPTLGLAYNIAMGHISTNSATANGGIQSFGTGYHETGVLLNSLLRFNLRFTDMYFNAGAFYHWTAPFDIQKNGTLVFSISTGF